MVKARLEVYKCELCGNMVETVHVGGGQLVCCGQEMKLVAENTTDAAQEKDGQAYRQFLDPGAAPEATFLLVGAGEVTARAYCNLHGLWKSA